MIFGPSFDLSRFSKEIVYTCFGAGFTNSLQRPRGEGVLHAGNEHTITIDGETD